MEPSSDNGNGGEAGSQRPSVPDNAAASSSPDQAATSSMAPASGSSAPSGADGRVEYSVILPTYNERKNLPLIIAMIVEHLRKTKVTFEILVVDDNSPDGTAEVFDRLAKAYPEERLLILRRPAKLGLGTAYIDGLKATVGSFVFLMDADLSHHPKYMPSFIAAQRRTDCDVVTGSRYINGGGVAGWNLYRILTSRVANHIATVALNPQVSDLTGSFRLYRRTALEAVVSKVKSRGYVFQMEIIVRCRRSGCRIEEAPITFVDRMFGESKLGANEITSYLKGVASLFWEL